MSEGGAAGPVNDTVVTGTGGGAIWMTGVGGGVFENCGDGGGGWTSDPATATGALFLRRVPPVICAVPLKFLTS